jgi:hypothetical protein
MGLGRWLQDRLDHDDGYEPDPDAVVTIAEVGLVAATVIVAALDAEGIEARAVELHVGYHGLARSHVMCFERDREAAVRIVDEVLAADGPS